MRITPRFAFFCSWLAFAVFPFSFFGLELGVPIGMIWAVSGKRFALLWFAIKLAMSPNILTNITSLSVTEAGFYRITLTGLTAWSDPTFIGLTNLIGFPCVIILSAWAVKKEWTQIMGRRGFDGSTGRFRSGL